MIQSKRTKRSKKELPEVSTASLPDIIFMLLFFFMVVTVMRTNKAPWPIQLPDTDRYEKVEHAPTEIALWLSSEGGKIMVNQQVVSLEQLHNYLELQVESVHVSERLSIPVHLTVDRDAPMSAVAAVKLILRKTGLRKLTYLVKAEPA